MLPYDSSFDVECHVCYPSLLPSPLGYSVGHFIHLYCVSPCSELHHVKELVLYSTILVMGSFYLLL